MTKQEILETLLWTKGLYTQYIDVDNSTCLHDFYIGLTHDGLEFGFCVLFRMALANEYDVLLELCRDLNTRHPNPLGILWYTAANKLYPTTTVEDIKQQALQPRLDHLNRTIARLQQELKTIAV